MGTNKVQSDNNASFEKCRQDWKVHTAPNAIFSHWILRFSKLPYDIDARGSILEMFRLRDLVLFKDLISRGLSIIIGTLVIRRVNTIAFWSKRVIVDSFKSFRLINYYSFNVFSTNFNGKWRENLLHISNVDRQLSTTHNFYLRSTPRY